MTELYIVRHCEAVGNVERFFQGSSDTEITDLGEKQLEFLKERFKDIPVDKIYSSPLKRAFKTAAAINGGSADGIETVQDLIEIHGGVIEGMQYNDILKKYPDVEYAWENEPYNFCADGGESMASVYDRAYETACKLAKSNSGKIIVATTHGGFIRCLLCKILYDDIKRLNDVSWSGNTAVTKLIYQNGKFVCDFINDTKHLPAGFLNRAEFKSVIKENSGK